MRRQNRTARPPHALLQLVRSRMPRFCAVVRALCLLRGSVARYKPPGRGLLPPCCPGWRRLCGPQVSRQVAGPGLHSLQSFRAPPSSPRPSPKHARTEWPSRARLVQARRNRLARRAQKAAMRAPLAILPRESDWGAGAPHSRADRRTDPHLPGRGPLLLGHFARPRPASPLRWPCPPPRPQPQLALQGVPRAPRRIAPAFRASREPPLRPRERAPRLPQGLLPAAASTSSPSGARVPWCGFAGKHPAYE